MGAAHAAAVFGGAEDVRRGQIAGSGDAVGAQHGPAIEDAPADALARKNLGLPEGVHERIPKLGPDRLPALHVEIHQVSCAAE